MSEIISPNSARYLEGSNCSHRRGVSLPKRRGQTRRGAGRELQGRTRGGKPASQPDAERVVAPQNTPAILCFLRTHLGKPGMWACGRKVSECKDFMLRTNRKRLELLFAQHRCFGCFLPLSVDGHLKLADCPHPRHCAMCDSPDHHQIRAPRWAYEEVILE
ncbi:hypothetical protein OUZ56_024382 [Daphnia magna]|uniref:Uncharacterized protein n=1 Tax=Daphnia magna TaxID=35525 RepID=A0ABR0B0Q1_9CRUS|nr:hypothetical protein OUZ56_024382 [Daphnia magna]